MAKLFLHHNGSVQRPHHCRRCTNITCSISRSMREPIPGPPGPASLPEGACVGLRQYSLHQSTTSLIKVSSTPSPLYTVLTVYCFPVLRCRMVVQNLLSIGLGGKEICPEFFRITLDSGGASARCVTVDQLYSPCVLWIWRRHSNTPRWESCGEVLQDYGVLGLLIRAIRH